MKNWEQNSKIKNYPEEKSFKCKNTNDDASVLWACTRRPNKFNLVWQSDYYNDCTLGPSTLRLSSRLLTKFVHHIPPIIRGQRRSNTESNRKSFALKGHVSKTQKDTDATDASDKLMPVESSMCAKKLNFKYGSQVRYRTQDTKSVHLI